MTVKFYTSNGELEITLTDNNGSHIASAQSGREEGSYEVTFTDIVGNYAYDVTGIGSGNDKISGGQVIQN